MQELVKNLRDLGVLKTPRLIEAFLACDRRQFVPAELADEAYLDTALPTRGGQTISQPYTVAFMLELLDGRPGQKILDVGFGSGWTTAILAHIVGTEGRMYGLEVNPEVFEFGKRNLRKFHYTNIELHNQSGWDGLPGEAPFDRILVSAAADRIPEALTAQLAAAGPFDKTQGRMVVPIGQPHDAALTLVEKVGENEFKEKRFPGFTFVPLVE